MEIDRLDEYDSIKIYTKEDREFIIDKPVYNKAQNHISGLSVREVTKRNKGAPFDPRFSLEEIKKIEYWATKEQNKKYNKRVDISLIIIFAIAALIFLKDKSLSIWVILYFGIAIVYYLTNHERQDSLLDAFFWPIVIIYKYFKNR